MISIQKIYLSLKFEAMGLQLILSSKEEDMFQKVKLIINLSIKNLFKQFKRNSLINNWIIKKIGIL